MQMTGGRLCGNVRYTANADPAIVSVCHCKNCQKQTGTAFSVVVGVPKSAVSIQGTLKTFHDRGNCGQPVDRNFCADCGSPIVSDVAVVPELRFIKAGTLDDTSWRSILKCMCIAIAQNPGRRYLKAARNLEKCLRNPRRMEKLMSFSANRWAYCQGRASGTGPQSAALAAPTDLRYPLWQASTCDIASVATASCRRP